MGGMRRRGVKRSFKVLYNVLGVYFDACVDEIDPVKDRNITLAVLGFGLRKTRRKWNARCGKQEGWIGGGC